MSSYRVQIEGKPTDDDGFNVVFESLKYPHDVLCPDCGKLAVWAEESGTPGMRRCPCGSLFVLRFMHHEPKPIGSDVKFTLVFELSRLRFYHDFVPAFLD